MHDGNRTHEPSLEASIGLVAIGRNEGERLVRCLRSMGDLARRAVYVDSGSSDDSCRVAASFGASVVELEMSMPFTAARARNAGWRRLLELMPDVAFVQFLDGDCELEPGWLDAGAEALRTHADLAVVFGRRRELAPDASRFNRLCDLEWDVAIGRALSCGGDALMRVEALEQVGGYDELRIAGEEPELCRRLRANGWGIERIDRAMTVHDAAIYRMSQWWRRAMRAGYVEAEGLAEQGRQYARWRSAISNLLWAVAVPLLVLTTSLVLLLGDFGSVWLAVVPIAIAVLLYWRSWRRTKAHAAARWGAEHARLYATFCLLGKLPNAQGMLVYAWRRLTGGERRLIEYKAATRS